MPVPSFEADLRAEREATGVSIEQIQHETRIPADVIQRFEAGKLLNDPAFNEVYLKAFLRAYAGAVGLPPGRVIEAFQSARAGAYRGGLGEAPAEADLPAEEDSPPAPSGEATRTTSEEAPSAPPEADPPGGSGPVTEGPLADPPAVAAKHLPSGPPVAEGPAGRAPAVAALSGAPEPAARPRSVEGPNEHFPKRRVQSASAAAAPRSLDRSWGTIIGGTVVLVLVVAGVLWLLFRDTSPEPVEEAVAVADTTGVASDTLADTTQAAVPSATAGPTLELPIRISVLAGGDGLQEFRTTEVPADRRPHWVEPGEELALESAEGVILWGEGADGLDPAEVTLRWQGFEWTPPEGQVLRVTPQNGQRLLDSLQAAGARRTP